MFRVLTLVLTLFTTSLLAQTNWVPATAEIDGREIAGEVNNRDWSFFVPAVDFRPTGGEATTYPPTAGVAFEYNYRRLVAAEVSYITNTRDLAKLTKDTTLNRTTEAGYLRQYVDGEVALYQYVDPTRKRHFYLQRDGGPLVYLEYELRLRSDSDTRVLQTLNNYRYQLSQFFSDCPDLAADIASVEYNDKSLGKLVRSWYRCRGGEPTFTARVDRGGVSFAPLAAVYRTSLGLPDRNNFEATMTGSEIGAAFGAGVRYEVPGQRRRFSVRADVFYHAFGVISTELTSQRPSLTTVRLYQQERSTLRGALLADYRILSGSVSVYTAAGLEYGLLLDNRFVVRETVLNPAGNVISMGSSTLSNGEVYQTDEIGFVVEAGVIVGKFQLGARVSRASQARAPDTQTVLRAGLIAGYWF